MGVEALKAATAGGSRVLLPLGLSPFSLSTSTLSICKSRSIERTENEKRKEQKGWLSKRRRGEKLKRDEKTRGKLSSSRPDQRHSSSYKHEKERKRRKR